MPVSAARTVASLDTPHRRSAEEPGRPDEEDDQEPETKPVITFRSGNQRAPADLAGFIKAGHDVGVTALGMTGPVRDQFVAHIVDGGNGFVDSGAFGTTKIEDGRGVPGINFDAGASCSCYGAFVG